MVRRRSHEGEGSFPADQERNPEKRWERPFSATGRMGRACIGCGHYATARVECAFGGLDREVAVEGGREAALARQEAMVEDLRKAELVRDRLESLRQSARAYPEGHDMRVLIEELPLGQALRAVEGYTRTLREALLYPRGT